MAKHLACVLLILAVAGLALPRTALAEKVPPLKTVPIELPRSTPRA